MSKKEARPWDFLNPNTKYVSDQEADRRFDICNWCPKYITLTGTCKECGCFMKLKTKLEHATCPLNKW
jgi:hypothetical protein